MSNEIIQLTDANFEQEVIQEKQPVLVDYWAEWCGPCKMIAPILEEIVSEYGGRVKVAKLNIDENPETPPKYGIRGIPTLMLFKDDEVSDVNVVLVSKDSEGNVSDEKKIPVSSKEIEVDSSGQLSKGFEIRGKTSFSTGGMVIVILNDEVYQSTPDTHGEWVVEVPASKANSLKQGSNPMVVNVVNVRVGALSKSQLVAFLDSNL